MNANEFEPKGKQKLTELFEGRSSQLSTQLMQLPKKIQKKFFFRLSFRNCISCVYNCDDLPSINSSLRRSHTRFSYTHNFKNNWNNNKKINCNIYIWGPVYGENLLRVKGSLAYPRYPKQASFSCISLRAKQQSVSSARTLSRVTLFRW